MYKTTKLKLNVFRFTQKLYVINYNTTCVYFIELTVKISIFNTYLKEYICLVSFYIFFVNYPQVNTRHVGTLIKTNFYF